MKKAARKEKEPKTRSAVSQKIAARIISLLESLPIEKRPKLVLYTINPLTGEIWPMPHQGDYHHSISIAGVITTIVIQTSVLSREIDHQLVGWPVSHIWRIQLR